MRFHFAIILSFAYISSVMGHACSNCLKTDIGSIPPVVGPCEALIQRWYIDGRECKSFHYGGCEGNANNFETLEECQSIVETYDLHHDLSMEPETGPCKAAFDRFYYDAKHDSCETFTYGGCQGNHNNFLTTEECRLAGDIYTDSVDLCALPPVVGRCRARMERYYFDAERNSCEIFYYGGCGGNANNFKTKKDCQRWMAFASISKNQEK